MGAQTFEIIASGPSAGEAFAGAVANAKFEYGHRGYTGTIAEKNTYRMCKETVAPDAKDRRAAAHAIAAECSKGRKHFSEDKHGPAACIEIGPDPANPKNKLYLFFGWAAS